MMTNSVGSTRSLAKVLTYQLAVTVYEFSDEKTQAAFQCVCKSLRTHDRDAVGSFDYEARDNYRKRAATRITVPANLSTSLFGRLPPPPTDTVTMLFQVAHKIQGKVSLLVGMYYWKKPLALEEFAAIFTGQGRFHRAQAMELMIPPKPVEPQHRPQARRHGRAPGGRQASVAPQIKLRDIALDNIGRDCPKATTLILHEVAREDLHRVMKGYPHLRRLELVNPKNALDEDFLALSDKLEGLVITFGVTGSDFHLLSLLRPLEELSLHGADFTWEDLAAFTRLPKLHALTLRNCENLTKKGSARVLQEAASIKKLTLEVQRNFRCKDFPMDWTLELLELLDCGWGESGFGALGKSSIQRLHLQDSSKDGDEQLLQLAQCKSLTSLRLSDCTPITTQGLVAYIQEAASLQKLDLSKPSHFNLKEVEKACNKKGVQLVKPNVEVSLLERLYNATRTESKEFSIILAELDREILEKIYAHAAKRRTDVRPAGKSEYEWGREALEQFHSAWRGTVIRQVMETEMLKTGAKEALDEKSATRS